jgi:hypothetical protein
MASPQWSIHALRSIGVLRLYITSPVVRVIVLLIEHCTYIGGLQPLYATSNNPYRITSLVSGSDFSYRAHAVSFLRYVTNFFIVLSSALSSGMYTSGVMATIILFHPFQFRLCIAQVSTYINITLHYCRKFLIRAELPTSIIVYVRLSLVLMPLTTLPNTQHTLIILKNSLCILWRGCDRSHLHYVPVFFRIIAFHHMVYRDVLPCES